MLEQDIRKDLLLYYQVMTSCIKKASPSSLEKIVKGMEEFSGSSLKQMTQDLSKAKL